jgi:hypothetical protein
MIISVALVVRDLVVDDEATIRALRDAGLRQPETCPKRQR